MREIKFRVWNEDFKMYLKPYSYPNGHSDLWLNMLTGDFKLLEGSYEYDTGCDIRETTIDNCTIEQYTGLKDKNGKEIYEGDIVWIAGIGKCTVEWDESILGFGFVQHETLSLWEYQEILEDADSLKVIGNIHENKDLLND